MTFSNYVEREWKNGNRIKYFKVEDKLHVAVYIHDQKPFIIDEQTLNEIHRLMNDARENEFLTSHKSIKDVIKELKEEMKE